MVDVGQFKQPDSLSGKFLTFALSRERYGIDILKVQEIIGVIGITKVPRCPDFLKGVLNLRGRIIPIIDLRLSFHLAPKSYDEKTCIIVVNISKENQPVTVGVIVDTVLEVIDFREEEIEYAPNYGSQIEADFICGMGRRNDSLNILLDIEKILSPSEKARIAEINNG